MTEHDPPTPGAASPAHAVHHDGGFSDRPEAQPSGAEARPWGPTSEVYATAYRTMLRLAFTITGSRETAEDVVHDTFIAAGHKLGDVTDPLPYLHRAVVNRCRSGHRSAGAERARMERDARGRPDAAPDPAGMAEFADLAAALERLPFNHRTAVVMRYLLDLPDEQIADALDCRPSTVRSSLRRGLATLRKELS